MTEKEYKEIKQAYKELIRIYQKNMDELMMHEAFYKKKEYGKAWEFLYDQKHDLEEKLHKLNMDFIEKDFTFQDKMESDLVSKNID